jgi:hypothetical protein
VSDKLLAEERKKKKEIRIIIIIRKGTNTICVKRKQLLSVLLYSKMPLVIHQLSVLNRDMFSSRSVYRTAAPYDQTDCLILCWILLAKSTTDVS